MSMQSDAVSRVSLIWAEVLQRDGAVSLDESFFEAGGDSLAMMMLLFRIKEELAIELAPAALMEAPTLRRFCQMIGTAGSGPTGAS